MIDRIFFFTIMLISGIGMIYSSWNNLEYLRIISIVFLAVVMLSSITLAYVSYKFANCVVGEQNG